MGAVIGDGDCKRGVHVNPTILVFLEKITFTLNVIKPHGNTQIIAWGYYLI